MKKLISCMLLLVMALTLAPVTIISAADVTEYWHTVEDFESYTGSVPTSSVYSYNLTSGINTASDYLNSGKQSLVLSYAGGKESPTVSVKAARGLFSGDGIRIWYKVTTDTNIYVVNAIFSDKSLKQLRKGTNFTPSKGTEGCYLEYRYADAGFTAEDAADIIGIQIKFNLNASASARKIYLDDLQVLNPPSFTKTIKGDELSLRNLRGSTINENQNVVSSGSSQYPQFYIDLPEPAYVSSVSVTLTNNNTKSLQLTNSGVGLKDVNDKVWNKLLGRVFDISNGKTSTLIIPVTADTLKTKIASIVIGANDTSKRMDVTVVSVTCTYAGNAAASVLDFKDNPIEFKTAYDSASAAVRSVVDLHYDSSYYAPKMLTGSYRMDDAYHGQLQFGVSNPEEQTTKTLADDGYFISEVGVLMLPGTLLNGEELLLTNEQAAKASLSLKSADCAPATYFAVLSDSDKYNLADISARAYIKYSDGVNEVVFYSRNNAEENTAEYAANAVENGVLTCTRNYAARLAAQKCYDKDSFYTETFPASDNVNFSEAGTLEDVISYLNAYTRANGGIAVIGDADANDRVDILDIIRIKKYLSGQAVEIDLKAADTNADGVNDPADLARLRKYLLGVEDLPAEPYTSDPVVTGVWTLL